MKPSGRIEKRRVWYITAIPLAQYQAYIGLRLCQVPTVAYWQLLLCQDCWQSYIVEVNNTYLLTLCHGHFYQIWYLFRSHQQPATKSFCLRHPPLPVPSLAFLYGPGLSTLLLVPIWILFLLVGFLKLLRLFYALFPQYVPSPSLSTASNHPEYIRLLKKLPIISVVPSSCVVSYILGVFYYKMDNFLAFVVFFYITKDTDAIRRCVF